MNSILSNTIKGFDNFIKKEKPDLIVVHGDRLEALAGALQECLIIFWLHILKVENYLELLMTLRHAISKLSHLHFVSNISIKKD